MSADRELNETAVKLQLLRVQQSKCMELCFVHVLTFLSGHCLAQNIKVFTKLNFVISENT